MPIIPPKPLTGNSDFEYRLRKIEDILRSHEIRNSPDIVADVTSQGTTLKIAAELGGPGGASTLDAQLMRVFAIYDDHLMCFDEQQNADGTVTLGSDRRYVLKPFELRRTPFHGLNWGNVYYAYLTSSTRQARPAVPGQNTPQGTQIEYQVITPAYQARTSGTAQNGLGSQILAIRNPGGLDPVYSQCTPPTGQPNAGVAQPVEWMEIGPGRVWAEYSFTP
jgi:hypothetical protein